MTIGRCARGMLRGLMQAGLHRASCGMAASPAATLATTGSGCVGTGIDGRRAAMKPKNSRTGSHRAGDAPAPSHSCSTPRVRGVETAVERAARSGFFPELAIRPGLLRPVKLGEKWRISSESA